MTSAKANLALDLSGKVDALQDRAGIDDNRLETRWLSCGGISRMM